MVAEALRSLRATLARDLMWTWSGVHFGYRRGDSLFTYDGIEAGRFSGPEVYGIDGRYLGEVQSSEEDGDRLVTGSYKKTCRASVFTPILDRPHIRVADRMALPLYCGYEHFPSPEIVKRMVLAPKTIQGMYTTAGG